MNPYAPKDLNEYKDLLNNIMGNIEEIHTWPGYPLVIQQDVAFFCDRNFAEFWKYYFSQSQDRGLELKQTALRWFIKHANDIIFSEKKIFCDGIATSLDPALFKCTTKMYKKNKLDKIPARQYSCTKSSVNYYNDYLETSLFYSQKSDVKAAVVSLASIDHPGSDYELGGPSQEADMYRRSLLSFQLGNTWPLNPMNENFGFFSEKILFFRSSIETGYNILTDGCFLNIITIPFNMKNQQEMKKKDYVSALTEKIDTIFRIAIVNEVTHLIFGSFGATGKVLIKVFRDVLKEKISEYAGYFKFVLFAFGSTIESTLDRNILEDSLKGLGYKKNFEVFYPEKGEGSDHIPNIDDDGGSHRVWVHLNKEPCKLDAACLSWDSFHFLKFTHKNVMPTFQNCPDLETCQNRDRIHRVTYLHNPDPPAICIVQGNNSDIDMKANFDGLMTVVNQFLKASGLEAKAKNDDLINFIKSLQPQHRCKLEIFQKVLAHAALMSRAKLVEFEKSKMANILSQIEASPLINKILEERKQKGSNKFSKWVYGIVNRQLAEAKDQFVSEWDKQKDFVKQEFIGIIGKDNIDKIKMEIENIIDVSNKVKPTGIGYEVDVELKTDHFVFCTIGPNTNLDYGEIIIFLSSDIMYHPDFNMTPIAGTSFMNKVGTEGITNNFKHRPWSKTQCPPDLQNNTYSRKVLSELFHKSKISAAIPGWVELFAAELVAKTFIKDKGLSPLEFHNNINSHFTFEGHMPEMVSFAYVEKIAMPKSIWNKLTPAEKTRLNILVRGDENLKLFDCPNEEIIKKISSEKFFKEIKHDSCKGFEFNIEKLYGHSFPIPIKMNAPSNKSYKIQFEAIGWDIHLSFSKSTQTTKNNPNQKEFLHFIFDNIYSYSADPKKSKTNNSSFTLAGTNNVKEKRYIEQSFVKRIEVRKDSADQQFEYIIHILYDNDGMNINAKKTNVIQDLMSSSAIGNGVASFRIEKTSPYFINFGDIQYVHMSCWERPIQVKNLQIELN